MKTYKNILLIIVLASFSAGTLLTGCSDFLAEKPYSFVKPEQMGDSNEAVSQWTTGVYSKMLDDMARWSYFPRILEMDCDYSTGPDWSFADLGAGNFQNQESIDSFWEGFYNMVFRANYAEYYISKMTQADEDVKNNGIGEVRFLKAFAYFMLTRAYGELPLFSVEESAAVMEEGKELDKPRSSISDVYAEIIRLLAGSEEEQGAIDLLYDNNNANFVEGAASKGAAAALLAKVYATMGAASLPAGTELKVRTGQAYSYVNGTMTDVPPVTKTFTKNAVTGYDFDWEDCYTKAAFYAEKVIKGDYGTYDLLPYENLWNRNYANKTEHMFMLAGVSGDEKYGTYIHRYFSGQQDGAGNISTGLWIGNRSHWYQLFDKDDLRIVDGVKHRYRYSDQESYNGGCYYPSSYKSKVDNNEEPYNDGVIYTYYFGQSRFLAFTTKYDDVSDPTQERTDAYWPFLRYADVLLIYAEAKCELESGDGVSTEAIYKLNDVRRRSKATEATTSGDGAITTKVDLRSAILEERAKEFAMEGDRRWDLIRWGIYIQAMNAIGGVNSDGTETKYDENNIYKFRENKHLLWPLPTSEVDSNSAIEENNPGWS